MTLVENVAVLYCDKKGPYPGLVREWYDEARDARTYAGPWPVVAHPPCGPWGRLRQFCTKQSAWCGPHAVEMVQRLGGVLEHPAESTLFRACHLPWPGEFPDLNNGRTYAVRQVAWGHRCEKPTWLYVVGVSATDVCAGLRTGGVATRKIKGRGSLPYSTKSERHLTPPAFAEWLVSLAEQATVKEAA